MDYVIGPRDLELFRRCRRAWDLGAQTRQNVEPLDPPWALDFARALSEALAVYYFPGMWDWPATVVNPIARQGFQRAMQAQRNTDLTAEQRQEWDSHFGLGEDLLAEYFAWAPRVDDLTPVRVVDDTYVQIPDPARDGRALATRDGRAIRFEARVDVLAMDEENRFWVMGHRFVEGGWPDLDLLLLDDEYVAWAWAAEQLYLIQVVGTIYNEIRVDTLFEPPVDMTDAARSPVSQHGYPMGHRAPVAEPTERIRQASTGSFRRTWINRSPAEIANFGERLAIEALDMIDPDLALYPSPSRDTCTICPYQPPCITINEGLDSAAVLAGMYRKRPPRKVEPGRMGGRTAL